MPETSIARPYRLVSEPAFPLGTSVRQHTRQTVNAERSMATVLKGLDAVATFRNDANGQVVLVLQGGGALGAYQAGVYQALHEAGIEPDRIVGTSIGAINASLIAGNEPAQRLNALRDFWCRVECHRLWNNLPAWTGVPDAMSYWAA